MSYLLDTCVISDFFKKMPMTIEHFERVSPKQIHISSISVMEIEYGLKLNSEREKKIRPIWDALLKEIRILPFSEPCANATAIVRAI
jgi:tRNA(fMet)-specific endonuclease VapC